ncbi:MAG: pilin glycosylation ligase domain-containing protein, partial [Campylobacterales bacterium]|nr:pilin glycosylation ligase domain-containing protein [Campylobacterales bacterium]
MQILCLIVASIFLIFGWLSPFHTYPWVTFSSELASFGAAFAVMTLFLIKEIKIPRPQILMLIIVLLPLLQFCFGLILDFSVAFLSFAYLFTFWLMLLCGYNLSLQAENREKLMIGFSLLVLVAGLLSSFMAVVQWLNLESYLYGIMGLRGNRPYANFGQPNNFSTFLVMALMGGLYLYEKRKASLWLLIPSSLIMLFTITLTQSRTAWIVCIFFFFYWIYKQHKNNPRFN